MQEGWITEVVDGYRVILEPDLEDGGYVVSCPAIRGCLSQGDSRDEALANIREAIELCAASLRDRGLAVPKPDAAEL